MLRFRILNYTILGYLLWNNELIVFVLKSKYILKCVFCEDIRFNQMLFHVYQIIFWMLVIVVSTSTNNCSFKNLKLLKKYFSVRHIWYISNISFKTSTSWRCLLYRNNCNAHFSETPITSPYYIIFSNQSYHSRFRMYSRFN